MADPVAVKIVSDGLPSGTTVEIDGEQLACHLQRLELVVDATDDPMATITLTAKMAASSIAIPAILKVTEG